MLRFLFLPVALLATTAALAQTSAPAATTSLGTITITAPTGTPQAVDRTLAPVLVLGKKDLQAFGGTNIADVLRFHAGLDVAASGGPGQPRSLFLRGTGSSEVLVLLDGIRVDPGTAGPPPFFHILAPGTKRVEVVKAPRAALYGTDAMGGVISIKLDQPTRDGFDWGALAGGGHYATRRAGVHAGGGNGRFFGGGAFNWLETAGFPPLTGNNHASAFRNQTVHLLGGAQNDSGEVYATLWRSTGTTDYLDFSGKPVSQDYTDRVASVHAESQLSNIWESKLVVGQFFDDLDNPHSGDFLHTWRNSLDWRNNVRLAAHHLLTAGLYLAHQHVNASSFGSAYEDIQRSRAVYLQDQMHYGANRIVFAGREAHFSTFGNQFVWNADYGYRFSPEWRVTAGLGTGFRAPRATDLYGFGGNPDLQPESSYSQNAAVYWKPRGHLRFGLKLYRNHITDLITYEATAGGGGQEENVGSATITGVNLSARMAYGAWRIGPAINIQRPLNDDTGGYLPRRSRRSVTLNLGYDPGRWRVGLHLLAKGRTKDSDFSQLTNGGYTLASLTGGFDITPQWRIGARIENLFDKDYADAAGYRTAGRGIYVTLSYNM